MHSFYIYGFKTQAILCDGAAPNLAAVKLLTGFGSGAYGVRYGDIEDKTSMR